MISEVTAEFRRVFENRHQIAQSWKEKTGGKVVGYMCTYVPEEILYAAGLLPVRIFGSHEPQDITEKHIYAMYCPFCRDCLAQGLKGRYAYLDGLVMAHSCIHMHQAYNSWTVHCPPAFVYYIGLPSHLQSPRARGFFRDELEEFKASMENWLGSSISPQVLREAIGIYDKNRRLLRQLYELRKSPTTPVTGLEAMWVVMASMLMDKREHNILLDRLLAELPQGQGHSVDGKRLILVGSEEDDTAFVQLIESLGGLVVIDDHCNGSRYFWNEAPAKDDPLSAIVDRYIDKPPCPVKDLVKRERFPHILSLAKEWRVDGAVVLQQKFCDPHEFDIPPLMAYLKRELGIPSLFLEVDSTLPAGQFRTRIEAFLEMLELGG